MRFAHHPTAGMVLRRASWPIRPGRNSSVPPARPVSWARSPSQVSRRLAAIRAYSASRSAAGYTLEHSSSSPDTSVTAVRSPALRARRAPRAAHGRDRQLPHHVQGPVDHTPCDVTADQRDENCRAPSLPSSSMIIPAPSVKVSVMIRPKRISPRLEAGSRKRCLNEVRPIRSS